MELPAGDYIIFKEHFYYNNGNYEATYQSDEPLAIPFTVAEGQITYLGELLAWGKLARNMFGVTVPNGGAFSWSDQQDRDLPLIRAKYPNLANMHVDMPDFADYFMPTDLAPQLLAPPVND